MSDTPPPAGSDNRTLFIIVGVVVSLVVVVPLGLFLMGMLLAFLGGAAAFFAVH
jgi:hypothetical protein